MADSAMVSAIFVHKKSRIFHPRFFMGINLHPLFSTKSVLRRNKSAMQMKSLRDEIRLRRDIKTDLISSKPKGFDFIQTCLDFIVNNVNDFIIEMYSTCGIMS